MKSKQYLMVVCVFPSQRFLSVLILMQSRIQLGAISACPEASPTFKIRIYSYESVHMIVQYKIYTSQYRTWLQTLYLWCVSVGGRIIILEQLMYCKQPS